LQWKTARASSSSNLSEHTEPPRRQGRQENQKQSEIILRWIAFSFFCIEAIGTVFWALPIFLYQLIVKRRPLKESFRKAIEAIFEVLSSPGGRGFAGACDTV
jgi:hypothetical protein